MRKTVETLESGGAPDRGQPLPVEFMNTSYARRGEPQEGIGTAEHLGAWLRDRAALFDTSLSASALLRLTGVQVARFQSLRDALRATAAATVDDRPAQPGPIDLINKVAAGAPRWPRLAAGSGRFRIRERTSASPVDAALAEIARSAMELFAGPERDNLRRCQGPGCVLYYLRDHPRKEWCSTACGTRVRVARHYWRHKE
jgi:predicted RNA-binding Zn ribbon-like protein